MDINGKVALVTGGASGLGEATVRALAARGANVVIVDLNAKAGQALAETLAGKAAFQAADVANPGEMEAAVNLALSRFGGLQIVANCAGIGPSARTVGKDGPHSLEQFEKVVRVNLIGSFNVTRLAAAAMAKGTPDAGGERGVIVNTASVAAFDGQIGQAAYAASKAGIVGMTLPIARDLSRDGIRVMTIAPGIFDTPLLASLPETVRQSLGQQVPFPPRLGKPEEFARLVVAIAENAMLNGETIRLDGAIRMGPK